MKYTWCLLFFGACIAISHGQDQDIPSSPSLIANSHENLRPLKRVARQNMPQPPENMPPPPGNVPPPPQMPLIDYYTFLRKKREARGGMGSLPTRKG